MKKVFFSLIFLVVVFTSFAVETTSGEYVIYKDKTFVGETWVGFLQYDSKTFGAMLYTPSENRRISILFSVKTKNEKMELVGQRIINKIDMESKKDVAAVNYLMELLPDFYAWGKLNDVSKSDKVKTTSKKISKPVSYFGGEIAVESISYVPLFGISKIMDKKGQELLSLSYIGKIIKDDNEFFNFSVPYQVKKNSNVTVKTNLKKTPVKLNSIEVNLDEQWTETAGCTFFLGNIAFLTLSDFEKKAGLNQAELVKFLSLSDKNRKVNLKKMKLTGNERKFTISNDIYDEKSQTVNFDKKMVALSGNTYTVASLTVSVADYIKYQKYFDSLFE